MKIEFEAYFRKKNKVYTSTEYTLHGDYNSLICT